MDEGIYIWLYKSHGLHPLTDYVYIGEFHELSPLRNTSSALTMVFFRYIVSTFVY